MTTENPPAIANIAPRTPQRAIRLALHVLLEELSFLDGERREAPFLTPSVGEIVDKIAKLYGATSERDTSKLIGSLCEHLEKFLESHTGDGPDELTSTADKLSDCWLLLDALTKGPSNHSVTIAARNMLMKHQAPGWKPKDVKEKLAAIAEANKGKVPCPKCGKPIKLDQMCNCSK